MLKQWIHPDVSDTLFFGKKSTLLTSFLINRQKYETTYIFFIPFSLHFFTAYLFYTVMIYT